MLALATSGIYLSFTRSIELIGFLAILSLYLVATGWQAAKQNVYEVGLFEKGALGVIIASSVACASVGLATAMSETGIQDDLPATGFYFLAGLAAYFGALDFSVIKRGGLAGKQRNARHLWRMCCSMFIVVTIFFLGNSIILPAVLRTPFFLGAPIIAVLVLMVFWLCRVLFTKYPPKISSVDFKVVVPQNQKHLATLPPNPPKLQPTDSMFVRLAPPHLLTAI
jgi:hypothetical protein